MVMGFRLRGLAGIAPQIGGKAPDAQIFSGNNSFTHLRALHGTTN